MFVILNTAKMLGQCWTTLRNMLHALWQLLGKSGTHSVFSRTLHPLCAENVKHASQTGVVISNTFFDNNLFFLSVFIFQQFFTVLRLVIMFFHPVRLLHFLCFISSLPRQGNISDHALLSDFSSSKFTLSFLKRCNRC